MTIYTIKALEDQHSSNRSTVESVALLRDIKKGQTAISETLCIDISSINAAICRADETTKVAFFFAVGPPYGTTALSDKALLIVVVTAAKILPMVHWTLFIKFLLLHVALTAALLTLNSSSSISWKKTKRWQLQKRTTLCYASQLAYLCESAIPWCRLQSY